MTMALKWVQENIGAFNGNPKNVTLFGQSAGGASVDLLSLSPHSRDLFHRVCPMAGNANQEWTLSDDAVEICRLKAAEIGVTSQNSEEISSIGCARWLGTRTKSGLFPMTLTPRSS
uniref:COesterase domain-containing protein n=1 Tax=Steinernema glaseri TaxID=37863 RepID=A0A1I7YAZ3_9BILA